MKKFIILLLLAFTFSAQAITRAEIKIEFANNDHLMSLAKAMEYIRNGANAPINVDRIVDNLIDNFAMNDTSLTTLYIEQMQNDDFSTAIIDARFEVYLRNCLRHDLAVMVNDTTIVYEP